MRVLTFVALVAIGALIASCSGESTTGVQELVNDEQRTSYALGLDIAGNLQQAGAEIEFDALLQGLKDGMAGADSLMTQDECRETMQAFQQKTRAAAMEKQQAQSKAARTEGEAFLTQNRDAEGVKVTESGLQYLVLVAGDGPKPKVTETVKVHYHGTLIDGTVFDSSVDRGQPTTFPLNRVISGWTEGLQLMPVGSKYKFFIPSQLAYGERSPSPKIPAGSTLIFEVELLEIVGN